MLDAMIAVRRVRQRPRLVDDAHSGLLRLDADLGDAIDLVPDLRMQRERAFDRGLRMELRRETDLEQHVLHDVAAVAALEGERLALEKYVVKAPSRRRQ